MLLYNEQKNFGCLNIRLYDDQKRHTTISRDEEFREFSISFEFINESPLS